jgi:hypothetical protein
MKSDLFTHSAIWIRATPIITWNQTKQAFKADLVTMDYGGLEEIEW